MAKLIALLRAVNLGARRKVPMADLRDLARELGLGDVATYIQSGNLLFTADRAADAVAKLEEALEERFGFPVDVVVRTAAQWGRYAGGNPFPAASEKEPNRVILLLSKAPHADGGVAALAARATAGEKIEARGDAVWFHYPEGIHASKLSPALIDRLLGSPGTARNWNTVLALQALLAKMP